MSNPTQIANLALSWLGQRSINSLNDNQTEAKVMEANYELSRDKTLEDYAWTFALERQTLAPVSDPPFGSENRFLIPSDVIRVHRVYRPNTAAQSSQFQNARWHREGKYIFAAEATIWALFIMRVTDSEQFSPGFVHALAARLAADTCVTLTENMRLAETMEAMYVAKIAQAAYSDGSQGRTEVMRSSALTGPRKR